MMYAKVYEGEILLIDGRPDWVVDGEPVSDEVLRAGGFECDENGEPLRNPDGSYVLATDKPGWLPVRKAEVVGVDELLNQLSWNDRDEWAIYPDYVEQTYTITNRALTDVKSIATERADKLADEARYAFVTHGGPGQALEYNETHREVLVWQSDPDPDIDDYPMLRAEYRARQVADPAITISQIVADTLDEIGLWRTGGAAIKEIRRTAKVAIEVAGSAARVREIIDWCRKALQDATSVGTFDPLPSE